MALDDLERARKALIEARQAAYVAIDNASDSQGAYEAASELMASSRELSDDLARKRAASAVRIRDHEALSLAGLANRLSMSKTRADQLVKLATSTKEVPSDD